MTQEQLCQALAKYLPGQSVSLVADHIIRHRVELKITKSRQSKLGDYRPPFNGKGHRISINHNLNQFSFLITLVHEIAHLTNWEKHGRKVAPHGKEWKDEFKQLMFPFLSLEIFPAEVKQALINYMQNPAAASCTDSALLKCLRAYDMDESHLLHVEDIPENTVFRLENGMVFRKGQKLRKRYKCLELKLNKNYLVNPLAKAEIVNA